MQNLKYHSILCAAYIKKYFLKQRVIALELPLLGEIPFLAPIVHEFGIQNGDVHLLIATEEEPDRYVAQLQNMPEYAGLFDGIPMIPKKILLTYPELIDVFASSEQYSYGLPGACSVCYFHGQPSKGVTFNSTILNAFDYFFLMGDLQLQALVTFLIKNKGEIDYIPTTVKVGYPKMDAIVNGTSDNFDALTRLGMDPLLKTVLYAPAFNEGASLRSIGVELIQCLASIQDINILIKLAPDMYSGTDSTYATGGINWFEKLKPLETDRLRVITDLDSNLCVATADVMVTDVSSIAFDFIYLDKPVIYYDCPDFYTLFTAQRAPYFSFKEFLYDDTINAGRNFGTAVQNLVDLKAAVIDALINPTALSHKRHEIIHRLLYNPGTASKIVVEELSRLAHNLTRKNHRHQTKRENNLNMLSPVQIQKLLEIYLSNYSNDDLLVQFYISLTKSDNTLTKVDSLEKNERKAKPAATIMGYIDAKATVAAATKAGLSVCYYRESLEHDSRKQGRRDRIINNLKTRDVLKNCGTICEIGAGSGIYLEKIIEHCQPVQYEVYETAADWVNFLAETYSSSTDLRLHEADGNSLRFTSDNSCNLVHAHAVFVYLPMLQVMEYLAECARVCSPGGFIVFDCFLDSSFSYTDVKNWLSGQWRFPVILPRQVIMDLAEENSLESYGQFREIYGDSYVDYLIFRKQISR